MTTTCTNTTSTDTTSTAGTSKNKIDTTNVSTTTKINIFRTCQTKLEILDNSLSHKHAILHLRRHRLFISSSQNSSKSFWLSTSTQPVVDVFRYNIDVHPIGSSLSYISRNSDNV